MDTPAEEIKKRDPIVFGVIAGSNKLYYITDWVDEYCDLTLAKFVDTLKITTDDLIQDETEKKKAEEKRKAAEAIEAKLAAEKKKAETAKKKNSTKKNNKTTKKTK